MKAMRRTSFLTHLALSGILLSLGAAPAAATQPTAGAKESSAKRAGALATYAKDLTSAARGAATSPDDYGDGVRRTLRVLARASRNNPLLVTDNAAGARSVVEGLARRVASGDVPESLRDKSIYAFDAARLVSEAADGAEFQQNFTAMLREAGKTGGHAILFVENLDALLSARDERQARAALDLLAGELSGGSVRVIATVSTTAFELKLAHDGSLNSQLQEIFLDKTAEASNSEDKDAGDSSDEGGQSNGADFVGDKISPDLREALASGAAGDGRVSLILQGDDLKNENLREFLKSNGARVVGSYSGLGAQRVEVPLEALSRLSEQTGVSYISPDREMKAFGGHVATTTGKDEIEDNQTVSSTGVTTTTKIGGNNIGIAIVDSGVYAAHKAFLGRDGKSRVIYSQDFTGEGRTDDPFGHGTHVAGLAAGNGQIAGGAYEGVAPDANIINLRVLNSKGVGTTAGLLAALNWVYNNRSVYNIRVVNMSLGASAVDSYKNDPVCRAARKLVDAGIVVAAAAGNDGKDANGKKIYGQIHSPGDEPSAITVGATNTFGTDTRADDVVATYSSRGPTRGFYTDANGVKHYDNLIKPDIVAPGNKLVSAESASNLLVRTTPSLDDWVSTSPTSDMMTLSGTSMATPIVAGSAALLIQVNPKLTPNMIKALMMYTAQQLRGFNAFEQGAGQLNVAGAAVLAKIVRTDLSASTPIGTPVFTKIPPPPYTTIAGYTFRWSGGVIAGHTFVTGLGLALYQKVYGLGTLLSDGITISEGVIISDHAVWSSGVLVSDNVLTSNGTIMTDGTAFCSTGVLVGDGVLLADGVIMGDGVILSEGVILGDGVLFGDSTKAMLAMLNGDPTASMTVVKDNGVVNLNY
jgi:serine protease AprX